MAAQFEGTSEVTTMNFALYGLQRGGSVDPEKLRTRAARRINMRP
jgi:hypothetical protein